MKGLILIREEKEAMRSLTQNRSISLLSITNRSLLECQIDIFNDCGINKIVIVANKEIEASVRVFATAYKDIDFIFFAADDDTLRRKLESVFVGELIVILAGPLITDIDLSLALSFHRTRESSATMILRSILHRPYQTLVLTDNHGRVTQLLPQLPAGGQMALASGNLYILQPEVGQYIVDILLTGGEEAICAGLMEIGIPVHGFLGEEYWMEIYDPAAYLQAHLDILSGQTKIKPAGREVSPGIWIGSGVKIGMNVKLDPPVAIGDRVEIREGAKISETVLGAGTYVDNDAVVRGSVFQECCYIGKQVQASGVIIGEETIVGKGAILRPGILLAPQSTISGGSLVGGAFICKFLQENEI